MTRSTQLNKNIGALTELKDLWLGGNQLSTLPDEIYELHSLNHLGLGENKLISLSNDISKLKNLNKLWIAENKLKVIPSGLFSLAELRKLDLRNNNFTYIPEDIKQLSNLLHIDVSNNSIEAIPKSIGHLSKLTYLNASNNALHEIPANIFEINTLRKLNFSNNYISILPDAIGKTINLVDLNLNGNHLRVIPEVIGNLTKLKTFRLISNQLQDLPNSISNLHSLIAIFADRNNISSLAYDFSKLKDLSVLGLSYNNLNEVPEWIRSLKNLKAIALNENEIKELPSWIATMEIPFIWKENRSNKGTNSGLNLFGNPLESPPAELVADGKDALKVYFDSFKEARPEDAIRLYEGKLLIVGEGDVGKTHIAHQLINNKLPDGKTTQGIDIHEWIINTDKIQNFRVNLWDFAGQAICHATHQFFLTKRSLYLFVWEARSDQDVTNFDYWLNIIKLLSNNSPVLIVMNKCDVRIKPIDQAAIQKEFPNVVGFHDISALKNIGITQLKQRIFEEMEKLPMIGKKLIKQWVRIREVLESQHNSNFITYKQYLKICKENHLNTEKAAKIAKYYHDLGVILHFQDDPILGDKVILNPEWATDAVYEIVDNMEIQKALGKFSYSDLSSIWTDYPAETHIFLIELMKKFELCFELPEKKGFIVPELLSPTQVDYSWDHENNLCFEYQYNFMPAGIITRFTVRQHEIISGSNYWKNGVCILWEDTKGLIVCDPFSKNISITISGTNPKGLLAIIRKDIESIHATLNNPKYEERIPCICDICSRNTKSTFHLYSKIKRFIDIGKHSIQCDNGNDVLINELLGEYGMDNTKKTSSDVYHIQSDNVVIGDRARINSDNFKGNKTTNSTTTTLSDASSKKWYEKLNIWVGIVAGIISIAVILAPFLKEEPNTQFTPATNKSSTK